MISATSGPRTENLKKALACWYRVPPVFQVYDPTGPTVADFLGAFLLAGVCGAAGAVVGHLLVRRMDDSPRVRSLGQAGAIGGVIGIWYPAGWVVALDGYRRLLGVYTNVAIGGGLPAIVTASVLGGVLLLVMSVLRRRRPAIDGPTWRASAVVAVTFAVVLPTGFVLLLPVLFPLLAR